MTDHDQGGCRIAKTNLTITITDHDKEDAVHDQGIIFASSSAKISNAKTMVCDLIHDLKDHDHQRQVAAQHRFDP